MSTISTAEFDDVSARDLAGIEKTTQEVGRYLFEHLEVRRPSMWERRWWDDRIMAWAMHDEAVKVQLFRFIDVLPMLTTAEAVVRHLEEYLGDVHDRLPSAARFGLVVIKPTALGRRGLAAAARRNALNHARRFIAGTDMKEVLAAALHERRQTRAFTIDVLGEAVASEIEADAWQRAYFDLIEQLGPVVNQWAEVPQIDRDENGTLPRVNVSIKLSALDSQFDPIDPEGSYQRVAGRLRPILRASKRQGAFVNVDMESYRIKNLTLDVFQRVLLEDEFRDFADAGIVIQCYLKDSAADLVKMRDWARRRGTPVWVRLVKGAYWDYETVHARATGWPVPVFQEKWQSGCEFRTADSVCDVEPSVPAAGGGEPQYQIVGACDCGGAAFGFAAQCAGIADAVRDGRRGKASDCRSRISIADLYAVRRVDSGHGVFGAAVVGEHVERFFFASELYGACFAGGFVDESTGAV